MLYGNFFFFVLGGWRAKRRLRDASNVSEKAAKIFGFSSVTPCRPQQCIKNCLTAKKICFTHGTCLSWFSVIVSYYAHLCVAIFLSLLSAYEFESFVNFLIHFTLFFFFIGNTRMLCNQNWRNLKFLRSISCQMSKAKLLLLLLLYCYRCLSTNNYVHDFFLYHNLCDMKQSHKMSVSNARATVWLQIL